MWASLIEFMIQCCPRIMVIDPNEEGVFVRLGKIKRDLQPGWYWCWPFIDVIYTLEVTPQIIDIPIQSLTSSDKVPVAVGGACEYSIAHIRKSLFEVQDFDQSLQNLVQGAVSRFIHSRSFIDCCNLEALEAEVITEVRKTANNWGLRIRKYWITDLVEHKPYRMMGGDNVVVEDGDE